MQDERTTILAGTDEGLHVWKEERAAAVDELAGREVSALAADGGHWWAIVDGRELWQSADALHWTLAATVAKGKPRATCLASTVSGLLVGTARAHLARLTHGRLVSVASFDEAEGRDAWYTPWGAPADVRSISADGDRAVYVNVHVGGVLRSAGRDAGWSPTLDIEHDVHQVLAVPGHAGTVVVAAADGFGITEDAGRTWRWDNAGLHAHYCRAVAVAGDTLLLSAATSYQGRQACVYHRPLVRWRALRAMPRGSARLVPGQRRHRLPRRAGPHGRDRARRTAASSCPGTPGKAGARWRRASRRSGPWRSPWREPERLADRPKRRAGDGRAPRGAQTGGRRDQPVACS